MAYSYKRENTRLLRICVHACMLVHILIHAYTRSMGFQPKNWILNALAADVTARVTTRGVQTLLQGLLAMCTDHHSRLTNLLLL